MRRDLLDYWGVMKELIDLKPPHVKIVNFGCDGGQETFNLMWSFNSDEAIGLDMNSQDIEFANQRLRDVRKAVTDCKQSYLFALTSDTDREWWDTSVPSCLKDERYPSFLQADMTRNTGLPESYFDLAYCSNVLYHLGKKSIDGIAEMKRVLKPEGWIIAREPTTKSLSDATIVDFSDDFKKLGLVKNERAYRLLEHSEGWYIYTKRTWPD